MKLLSLPAFSFVVLEGIVSSRRVKYEAQKISLAVQKEHSESERNGLKCFKFERLELKIKSQLSLVHSNFAVASNLTHAQCESPNSNFGSKTPRMQQVPRKSADVGIAMTGEKAERYLSH